jgi:hypothetical protein
VPLVETPPVLSASRQTSAVRRVWQTFSGSYTFDEYEVRAACRISLISSFTCKTRSLFWPFDAVLPKPTIFWVEDSTDVPPGLYISPNRIHFPEVMRKQGFNSLRHLDPWQHFYARFMREDTLPLFWTAILPRRQVFDGFLDPLNRIEITYRNLNGRSG